MENTPKVICPTLEELTVDLETAYKNDQYNLTVNQQPPAKWLKNHPIATIKNHEGKDVPLPYLPIDKVEYLLTRLFQKWNVEVKSVQQIFNSVSVTIRLHYFNRFIGESGEWQYQDGVGAVAMQLNKGAKSFEMHEMKSVAVQIALPAAESYAIKDAAEKIGVLFGKDLGRQNSLNFAMTYTTEPVNKENVKREIEKFTDAEELLAWWADLPNEIINDKVLDSAMQSHKLKLEKKGAKND